MKTIYFLAGAFFFSVVITSCQKLNEDPRSSLTPASYFKTQADLDASVAAIYQQYTVDGAYAFTNKITSYFGADDLTTDPGLNKEDMRAFDELNGSSANVNLVAEWQGPWTAIYQANNVITNYQKVTSTDELKNASAGQAYFLRAWGYYNLVRTFGQVPIIDKTIDVNDRPARNTVSDVYDFIISDLIKAKKMLPLSFSGQPGKQIKWLRGLCWLMYTLPPRDGH